MGAIVGVPIGYILIPRIPRQDIGMLAFVPRFAISWIVFMVVWFLVSLVFNFVDRMIDKEN
jgi:hypothetical protein